MTLFSCEAETFVMTLSLKVRKSPRALICFWKAAASGPFKFRHRAVDSPGAADGAPLGDEFVPRLLQGGSGAGGGGIRTRGFHLLSDNTENTGDARGKASGWKREGDEDEDDDDDDERGVSP